MQNALLFCIDKFKKYLLKIIFIKRDKVYCSLTLQHTRQFKDIFLGDDWYKIEMHKRYASSFNKLL